MEIRRFQDLKCALRAWGTTTAPGVYEPAEIAVLLGACLDNIRGLCLPEDLAGVWRQLTPDQREMIRRLASIASPPSRAEDAGAVPPTIRAQQPG